MELFWSLLIIVAFVLFLMGLGLLARWIFLSTKKGYNFFKSIKEITIYFRKKEK